MAESEKICYIIGAGENYGLDFTVTDGDFLIAADGGYKYCLEKGLVPDLIVGDFDSLGVIPQRANVVKLNAVKDNTDVMAAIDIGIEKGYKTFHIYCGTGGRIDHTLANIQYLCGISKRGFQGFLYAKNQVITAITNRNITFDVHCKGYVSVFSANDRSSGVNIKGLKYELENAVITNTFPLGVSNEFIGKPSEISVDDGTLIIIYPCVFP